jgi:hypothetical protein
MIRLQCACGKRIAAPDPWLGKRVKCPQCGQPVLVVPADAPAAEAPAAQTPRAEILGQTSRTEPSAVAAPQVAAGTARTVDNPRSIDSETASALPMPPVVRESEPQSQRPAPIETSNWVDDSEPEIATAGTIQPPAPAPSAIPRVTPVQRPMTAAEAFPDDDEDDFYTKQQRLPRVLGTLGLLVALAAAVSCWFPQFDRSTLYIALGGVAIATIGFGLSMSRHRVGLTMPLIGLIASLLAMCLPFVLPHFGKIAPAHYMARVEDARQQKADAEVEAQRRGILSVVSLQLTGSKNAAAPEVAYKLINKSGKVIQAIEGSIQLTDRDHRPIGGMVMNVPGPIKPGATVQGSNNWTMEQATQSALAESKFDADYRANAVVYGDGTVMTFPRP